MAKKKRTDADKSDQKDAREVDFEAALAEVEQVVEQLESGALGLSDSLVQYERGIQKIKQCHQVLEQAERKIAVLTAVDEDGTPSVEPVETGIRSSRPKGDTSGKTRAKRVPKTPSPPINDVDESDGLF
ncbi:exodeoxyribonuclease VII small subunit [Stieleria sp. TO1_6]|uniref:exodeoxyribonuclease VII small subunit n=1 Tax=Stieleria tagensis TaxID=2956795 RepID=UPI00209AFD7E|nr:exodeoxyribonuclease VII small subunit [Stieleria tagensis]MCO8122115.1 exodeoxyribonuclease VII small subunit [Stieleria tagensis]